MILIGMERKKTMLKGLKPRGLTQREFAVNRRSNISESPIFES